jgi:putative methionine-R-sulfoxide reductase with GAF domain
MESSYLEGIYTHVKAIKSAGSLERLIEIITQDLPTAIGAKYCSLFIKNQSSGELELRAHNHQDIGEDPFIHIVNHDKSIMNLTISRNTSLLIRNIEEEMGFHNKDKYSTKSFMCLLIRDENEIEGVLNLADKTPTGFTREDMLFSTIIAEFIGGYLKRYGIASA